MKPAVIVQEQIAQSSRVKEQAEQTIRVSLAFTKAEAKGRSAQMNVPKGSVLLKETLGHYRNEKCVEMMA